jgi:hypothetical protein
MPETNTNHHGDIQASTQRGQLWYMTNITFTVHGGTGLSTFMTSEERMFQNFESPQEMDSHLYVLEMEYDFCYSEV